MESYTVWDMVSGEKGNAGGETPRGGSCLAAGVQSRVLRPRPPSTEGCRSTNRQSYGVWDGFQVSREFPVHGSGWHTRGMPDHAPLQGELQVQIMAALWRIEAGTVEEVREALPSRYRSAYNTVQTVLNRLAERELLDRERRGMAYVYRPTVSEADYVARSIRQTLAGASSDARETALAQLIGSLPQSELTQLQERAKEVARRRRSS
jgi:predicted transcriptional regulator